MIKNDKPSDFSKRLQMGMSLKNMRQVDIVEKTGIKKSALSHYVKGMRSEVSLEVVHTIAQALDVNPVWLLGYDVPMDSSATYSKESADFLMDSFEDKSTREVMEIMRKLDDNGKNQILQYSLFVLSQNQK